jgi:hypothetical protein
LDKLAHSIAQADFDRIKPIVEKMDRRLGLRLQGCRVRAIARLGQPDGISPSRMAEMLEVDKSRPKVRC